MGKNRLILLTLAFLLLGMAVFVNQIQKVGAVPANIYIRSDGRVDPPTTNITNVNNVTYTLTSDIVTDFSAIIVERDNIIIDGAGHTVLTVNKWNGVDVRNRSNVTIKNFNITNCTHGIFIDAATLITIDNCTFTGNDDAIMIGYSGADNCTITHNNVTGQNNGLSLDSTSDTMISGNTVQGCGYAIILNGGVNVTVQNNLITGNTWGIWPLGGGSNITIFNNTISNNYSGVSVQGGNDTTRVIYHNLFINNTIQAESLIPAGATCKWDNGYPSGGNYWSGYVNPDLFRGQFQNVTGGDGIGDNPYVIDGNNRDNYPFMLLSICNVSQIPSGESILPTDQVRINATVTHQYTVNQVIVNCTITNGTGTFTRYVNMINVEGNIWNVTMPALPAGANVSYVIIAEDIEGNVVNSQQQGYAYEYQVVSEFSSIIILLPLAITTLFMAAMTKRATRTKKYVEP